MTLRIMTGMRDINHPAGKDFVRAKLLTERGPFSLQWGRLHPDPVHLVDYLTPRRR